MQPYDDPHMKKFSGYTQALWQYTGSYELRQTDMALRQWYERGIRQLQGLVNSFRYA